MKITIACDSFKGSLSSIAAGSAAAKGILDAMPEAEISVYPTSDGGEGIVDALITGLHGQICKATVSDPLGRPITAKYGILPDQTAVIEMAEASGLCLLSESERNPMHASSRGFGELILHAAEHGARRFLLGIGGSATNDGGIGCMEALGFRFLDESGSEVPSGAAGLGRIHSILCDRVPDVIRASAFSVACDVNNPLCGASGCSMVFSPQKGADAKTASAMDRDMQHYAEVVRRMYPEAAPDAPGSGAAGGMGFALRTFLNAEMKAGFLLVAVMTGLSDAIAQSDLVITGEGRMDAQTAMGKVPAGVARLSAMYEKTVIAFCGAVKGDMQRQCEQMGITAAFPILRAPCTEQEAMQPETAAENLRQTAAQVFRLIGQLYN